MTKRKLKKVTKKESKEELEIVVDILGGNKIAKFTNEMMHTADVFEKGKQLATHESLIIKGSPDLSKLCEVIKGSWEKAGGYVVFVGIRTVDGKRPDNSYSYFMENVQSISMKQKNRPLGWALFKDILSQLGYEAEVDKNMRVIKII